MAAAMLKRGVVGSEHNLLRIPKLFTERSGIRRRHASRTYSVSGGYRQKGTNQYALYGEMNVMRQVQADNSVLIQHANRLSAIYHTCRLHGRVQGLYPFNHDKKEYVLVELADQTSLSGVMEKVHHFSNTMRIKAETRFLYYNPPTSHHAADSTPPSKIIHTQKEKGDLRRALKLAKSISDQMTCLHKHSLMPELATRLRYFLCSVLEESLRGILPQSRITPFGSSVNGFGKFDCDLDMHIDLDDEDSPRSKSGLFFLTKVKQENERLQHQMVLEALSGVISNFVPQFSHVRRILKARIPILKFTHRGTGLECDLSSGNRSAIFMSELLYVYGQLDPRVRPLVFSVRHWARANQITRSNPGPWISNFMLTWMGIYFLQVRPQPVLPPVGQLRKLAVPGEQKVLNGQDMTFITDWTKVPASSNTETPGDLLLEFFSFYANFDFGSSGISAVEGCLVSKPDLDPFYLENPLERSLNAGKNVIEDCLVHFQQNCDQAYHILLKSNANRQRNSSTDWGLAAILPNGEVNDPKLNVTISRLFHAGDDSTTQQPNSQQPEFSDTSSRAHGSFSEPNQPKPAVENTEDSTTESQGQGRTIQLK